MTIERASTRVVLKPWGCTDLRPWNAAHQGDTRIGEIWFERSAETAPESALLVKLLFTTEPLSIQVHPTDAYARSVGLANGKTEAWYILSATPDAQVALGLKRTLTAPELRASIEDGSIADLVQWHPALPGDVLFVPAGTIHAIGAGLVIAEVQQTSDTTFRLFDYGRDRELHIEDAVATAFAGPAEPQTAPRRLSNARTLLAADPHFALERLDLAARSDWDLQADQETWLLVLHGHARIGSINVSAGEAIYLRGERARIEAGPGGLKALMAYVDADSVPTLLRGPDRTRADLSILPMEALA